MEDIDNYNDYRDLMRELGREEFMEDDLDFPEFFENEFDTVGLDFGHDGSDLCGDPDCSYCGL